MIVLVVLFVISVILNQLLNSIHRKEIDENIKIIMSRLEELDKNVIEIKKSIED